MTSKKEPTKSDVAILISTLEKIHGKASKVAGILEEINEARLAPLYELSTDEISDEDKTVIETWISNSEKDEDSYKVARVMVWYIATHCLKIETGKILNVSFTESK